jgi:hypothetical protein
MSKKGGYYAVKAGRQPGLYRSWAECEAQVKGFSGGCYKRFAGEQEAREFAGVPPPSPPGSAVGMAEERAAPVEKKREPPRQDLAPTAAGPPKNAQTGGEAWGRVTSHKGKDLLARFALLLGDMNLKDVKLPGGSSKVIVAKFAGVTQQNNGAELLAMIAGLRIALCTGVGTICSDSELLTRYWSRGRYREAESPALPPDKLERIRECALLRELFEAREGCKVEKISGGENKADLGFHRD